jgi:hypothetical protein
MTGSRTEHKHAHCACPCRKGRAAHGVPEKEFQRTGRPLDGIRILDAKPGITSGMKNPVALTRTVTSPRASMPCLRRAGTNRNSEALLKGNNILEIPRGLGATPTIATLVTSGRCFRRRAAPADPGGPLGAGLVDGKARRFRANRLHRVLVGAVAVQHRDHNAVRWGDDSFNSASPALHGRAMCMLGSVAGTGQAMAEPFFAMAKPSALCFLQCLMPPTELLRWWTAAIAAALGHGKAFASTAQTLTDAPVHMLLSADSGQAHHPAHAERE